MLPYTTKIFFFKKDDRPGTHPTGYIYFQTKYRGYLPELQMLYKNSAPGKRKCAWYNAYFHDNRTNKPSNPPLRLPHTMNWLNN